MNKIKWQYYIAAPREDISPSPEELCLPLEGDLAQTSYRQYFETIKAFVSQEDYHLLYKAICQQYGITNHQISQVILRAEKHGAFYHPASIECVSNRGQFKFGVNVATHPEGKKWLKRESILIQHLNKKFKWGYLPKVYHADSKNGMFLVLCEWFEGYHEFHLSKDKTGKEQIILWDFQNGYRYLNPNEAYQLFKQITFVLILYYDLVTYDQIYPWHHAAGDFIVKTQGAGAEVKLTTVRGYTPIIGFLEQEDVNPIFALLFFFLNLTLRMRQDRLDGTKQVALVGKFCLKPTLEGFLEGLKQREGELIKTCGLCLTEFVRLLKSFQKEELYLISKRLLPLYKGKEGFSLLSKDFENHVDSLYKAIQSYPE